MHTTRAATRSHRIVRGPIAILRDLQRGGRNPLAATQTKIEKNPGSKPAEFPRAADRSSVDEFAQAIVGRTIPVRTRSDEIFRAEQILHLQVRAVRFRFLIARAQECSRAGFP